MQDGPGTAGESARDARTERAEEALADLKPDEREADQVKGGDFTITKSTDSASPKLS